MYFRLLYVSLKYDDPVREASHDGTSDSALMHLHSLLREDEGIFGQLLAADGWVLANVAPPLQKDDFA